MVALDIQQLPKAWLLRFTELLPNHLKLVLRQCSRALLHLVDSHSTPNSLRCSIAQDVGGSIAGTRFATALSLCYQHVACLDLSRSFVSVAPCGHISGDSFPSKAAVRVVQQLRLPALKQVKARVDQQILLEAIANSATPNKIQQLSLWCCAPCAGEAWPGHQGCRSGHDHEAIEVDELTLTGLEDIAATYLSDSLTRLELLGTHFCITADEGLWCMKDFLQHLTSLQSLRMSHLYNIGFANPDSVAWDLADLGPLTCLTHLDLACSPTDDTWNQTSSLQAQLTGMELQHLTTLRDLKLAFSCAYELPMACLTWLPACQHITRLHIISNLDWGLFKLLFGLINLQDLVLHGGTQVTTHQLLPLTACKHLTSLSVDELVVLPPPGQHESPQGPTVPAAPNSPHALVSQGSGEQSSGPGLGQAQASEQLPAGQEEDTSNQRAVTAATGCLRNLLHLDIGNMGAVEYRAPVATFAPGITRLHDSWWRCDESQPAILPINLYGAESVDALAGLLELRVLDLDLHTLDRHVRHIAGLTALSNLRELRLEAVGERFEDSRNMREGLPQLPQVTKLLIYTQDDVLSEEWPSAYCSEEDAMLWSQQRQLRELAIKGSVLLGGFLVDADIAQQLPMNLPLLQCISLQDCPDLASLQLAELVAIRPAPVIRVQGCRPVTDRDCQVMMLSCSRAVCVDYC